MLQINKKRGQRLLNNQNFYLVKGKGKASLKIKSFCYAESESAKEVMLRECQRSSSSSANDFPCS